MSHTLSGGFLAAQTNKNRHGPDFYQRIGRIGGSISRGGGFTGRPDLAKIAGIKGGSASGYTKRSKSLTTTKG